MKRSRLTYDDWKCIVSKNIVGVMLNSDLLNGYIGLIEIEEVSKAQIWNLNGKKIIVCDKGKKWLSILPKNDGYCITAMMDHNGNILLWYIDIIAAQGIDEDKVPYFYDLYLDLVVYPNGKIIVEHMDELKEALRKQEINQDQYNFALETSNRLQNGILSNISFLKDYTVKCY